MPSITPPAPKGTRHGYVSNPLSRAALCKQDQMGGAIQWEPQSVEALKGFPRSGPPDGQLASGGHERFAVLDALLDPKGREWRTTRLPQGTLVQWDWWLTAPHKTSGFEYFITKDGWDPNEPLSRAQFDPLPFLVVQWDTSAPVQSVSHWGLVPRNKDGRHVVYGVWTVDDTDMAFYSTCDVDIVPSVGRHAGHDGQDASGNGRGDG